MEYILIITILLSSSLFLILLSIYKFFKNKEIYNEQKINIERIEKFPSYLSILEHYMNLSYQIVYKERIMVYSIEASRLSENELNSVAKDYITLTLKYMGPNLQNEFENLYGNSETLYFVIGQNFYTKYEDDKIRDNAQDNLMDYSDSEYNE